MLSYQLFSEPDILLVRIKGELEYSAIETCLPMIAEFKEAAAKRFIVDLSELEFIDSSGMGILISIRNSAVKRGSEFVIRGARDRVAQILKNSRFDILANMEG